MKELLKEFKPALGFLGKFVALYLIGNVLYGVYIESHGDHPDKATHLLTAQTSSVLNLLGYETDHEPLKDAPKVALKESGRTILFVFEGCNGVNVMIVFTAFLFAFGGALARLLTFMAVGLVAIHFFNILRISLLFYLSFKGSNHFHYYHKYFFTGILYLVVLGLWGLWIGFAYEKTAKSRANSPG